MKVISNPNIVRYSPIVTTILLESSTIGHIFRMWLTRTSEGQSLLSWIYVILALTLWFNWYRVFAPTERLARWSTVVGMLTSSFGLFSVIYFRYLI
jgi:hypothetical protein